MSMVMGVSAGALFMNTENYQHGSSHIPKPRRLGEFGEGTEPVIGQDRCYATEEVANAENEGGQRAVHPDM